MHDEFLFSLGVHHGLSPTEVEGLSWLLALSCGSSGANPAERLPEASGRRDAVVMSVLGWLAR